MDLGQVQIAVGIDWHLLDGIVRYLYRENVIPAQITLQNNQISIHLEEPRIELVATTGSAWSGGISLALKVRGDFAIGVSQSTAFFATVLLEPVVINTPPSHPVASFSFNGVVDVIPENLEAIFNGIAEDVLADLFQHLAIPLYEPLINSLASAYYPDNPPPMHEWSLGFCLAPVGFFLREPNYAAPEIKQAPPSLIATLALPGQDPSLPLNQSITPTGSGLQIIISKAAMNAFLHRSASQLVGKSIQDATIKSLNLSMGNHEIEISGKAKKSGATISWDGSIYMVFHNYIYGKTIKKVLGQFSEDGYLEVVTSNIDVDVDMPWYLDLFQGVLILLGPLGQLINGIAIGDKLEEAGNAPGLVRGALGVQVKEAFQTMAEKFSGISDRDELPVLMFGSDAWIAQGNYFYTFKAFCGYNETTINKIIYDEFELPAVEGQSVGAVLLDSGHYLIPTELGRLMKLGILNIPGYHGVRASYGYYFRSNPNTRSDDNLVPPSEIHTH